MKKVFMIIVISVLLAGCTMNESKEARIQKLETEIIQSVEKINALDDRVTKLEAANEQLKARMLELESD